MVFWQLAEWFQSIHLACSCPCSMFNHGMCTLIWSLEPDWTPNKTQSTAQHINYNKFIDERLENTKCQQCAIQIFSLRNISSSNLIDCKLKYIAIGAHTLKLHELKLHKWIGQSGTFKMEKMLGRRCAFA